MFNGLRPAGLRGEYVHIRRTAGWLFFKKCRASNPQREPWAFVFHLLRYTRSCAAMHCMSNVDRMTKHEHIDRQEKTRSMTDADGADAERGEPAKHWPVLTSADKC